MAKQKRVRYQGVFLWFRNHLPTYLGKVKAGEAVVLTVRGKVIARLVPEVDECSAAR